MDKRPITEEEILSHQTDGIFGDDRGKLEQKAFFSLSKPNDSHKYGGGCDCSSQK